MEENQQTIIPEKIKYKFLSYLNYSTFKDDLDNGKILDDAIVFIKNVRRIWARGAEYSCDTLILIEDGTITILDADGNVKLREQFPKKSDFEEAILSINNNIDIISQGLVAERNRAESEELQLDGKINSIQNSVDNSLTELNASLNNEIASRENQEFLIREQISTVDANVSHIVERIDTTDTNVSQINERVDEIDTNISQINERITAEENTARNAENSIISRIVELEEAPHGGQALIAGRGIDINEDTVSVKDYIGEESVNEKLKILQLMLAQMYVLKSDVYNEGNNITWSDAPIYSFEGIATANDESSTSISKGNITAISNGMFNVLLQNNDVRNEVCYFITNDETILSGDYEILENAGIIAIENNTFDSLIEAGMIRNDTCYLITV